MTPESCSVSQASPQTGSTLSAPWLHSASSAVPPAPPLAAGHGTLAWQCNAHIPPPAAPRVASAEHIWHVMNVFGATRVTNMLRGPSAQVSSDTAQPATCWEKSYEASTAASPPSLGSCCSLLPLALSPGLSHLPGAGGGAARGAGRGARRAAAPPRRPDLQSAAAGARNGAARGGSWQSGRRQPRGQAGVSAQPGTRPARAAGPGILTVLHQYFLGNTPVYIFEKLQPSLLQPPQLHNWQLSPPLSCILWKK